MPPVVKNSAAIVAQVAPNASSKSTVRKWVERSLMLTALVGTIIVVMMFSDLISRYFNPPLLQSTVYGKWVEQSVPAYAREEFVLSDRGVTAYGATLATEFELDRGGLSYKVGSKVRRFEFIDSHRTEMRLDSEAYYRPVFRLQGTSQTPLR